MEKKDFIELRKEIAASHFLNGYNCAQSVALAFYDFTNLDKETILRLSSPFGGGMGQMREVCGAVSGMLLIEGLIRGYSSPTDKEEKQRVYCETKHLAEKFKGINGSIVCHTLLEGITYETNGTPAERTEEYYRKRPCGKLVEIAAEILAEHIFDTYPHDM